MEVLLSTDTYQTMPPDPTTKIENLTKHLNLKSKHLNTENPFKPHLIKQFTSNIFTSTNLRASFNSLIDKFTYSQPC